MNTEHYKKVLLSEKAKLEKEINYFAAEDPYMDKYRSSETLDDAITEIEGHDRIVATKAELEISQREVNEALNRIETGTFGRCLSCNQEISEERLSIMPTASLCASCQSKKKTA